MKTPLNVMPVIVMMTMTAARNVGIIAHDIDENYYYSPGYFAIGKGWGQKKLSITPGSFLFNG